MTYYYVHAESGCAFPSDEPPSRVMNDPCVELATRRIYEQACRKFDIPLEPHPDPCEETRQRIKVAVAAWAYEVYADPIMSDGEFDALARGIDVDRSTLNESMDNWFACEFDPNTSQWVHRHPNTAGLERIYRTLRPRAAQMPLTGAALGAWIAAA